DGLGDDEALREATLDGEVVVYFPDTVDSLYQLRSWYGPLQELHRAQGVTIVCMDSRAAAKIRAEVPLPVVTIALDATLDAIILRSGTKLVLYVNYNPLNTAALRSRSAIHVSLLHGDSDKIVSVSTRSRHTTTPSWPVRPRSTGWSATPRCSTPPRGASRSGALPGTPTGCPSRPARTTARPSCTRRPGRAVRPRPDTALCAPMPPRPSGPWRRRACGSSTGRTPSPGCGCQSSARPIRRCENR